MILNKHIQKNINNQSGMAILMVISVVAILAYLLADLTYETNINRIRSYNLQERTQARLNAESGLRLALTKLKLYKEGRNLLENNESARGVVRPSILEKVAISPFLYPIPKDPKMGLLQRSAIDEFSKKTLLQGEVSLMINPVKGFLNPNNLRIVKKKGSNEQDNNTSPDPDNNNEDDENSENAKNPQQYFEKKLVDLLSRKIKEKSEEDDEFNNTFANIDPQMLVKELKFYVNAPNAYDEPERVEFEALYNSKGLVAKHSPLTSIDELYSLDGWSDAIVDLVKNELTVHEATIIAVNEINKEQLKLLFPTVSDEQAEEFFKYRDGDKQLQDPPHPFKTVDEFKEAIINRFGIADNTGYEERMKELKNAGLQVGVAGKLYRVVSVGKFGKSTYSITAFIDLPVKPQPPPPKKDPNNPETGSEPDTTSGTAETEGDKKKKNKVELLEPRVIEIRVGESA
ncbi:MAG: hypothetical protein OHK0056_28380 [Bacteriovoracaceae bacterium]